MVATASQSSCASSSPVVATQWFKSIPRWQLLTGLIQNEGGAVFRDKTRNARPHSSRESKVPSKTSTPHGRPNEADGGGGRCSARCTARANFERRERGRRPLLTFLSAIARRSAASFEIHSQSSTKGVDRVGRGNIGMPSCSGLRHAFSRA